MTGRFHFYGLDFFRYRVSQVLAEIWENEYNQVRPLSGVIPEDVLYREREGVKNE